jgi:hypothetical protein
MKRFHTHVSVHDLSQSIRFCSTVFGTEPSRVEAELAAPSNDSEVRSDSIGWAS